MVSPKVPSTDPIAALAAAIPQAAPGKKRGLPPVHLWNPPYCGDIGLRIKRDGSWYQGPVRFTREPLVRLFSTILRKDDDGKTYLVTPVEKILIEVEDAPFIAIRADLEHEGGEQILKFQTNVGDEVIAGPDNPIRVETDPVTLEPAPYILVRGKLEARIARASFYEMVDWAEEENGLDGPVLGLRSKGCFFPLGPAGAHLIGTCA
jgi:hypothetical protein